MAHPLLDLDHRLQLGGYKYWNENLGTKFNGEIQQLACSGTVPVNPSYYNLNDQDPNLALEYKYSLDRNSMPTSWSSIAEWPMNVDGTIYSEGKYEVHSWLKDSFNKPLYAGSDIIHFDNNSPIFEATLLRSNAVIIDLVINDLLASFYLQEIAEDGDTSSTSPFSGYMLTFGSEIKYEVNGLLRSFIVEFTRTILDRHNSESRGRNLA